MAMRRGAPAIGAELIVVALVLACLGGSLALVVTMHRRHATPKKASPPPVVVAAPAPPPKPRAKPRPTPVVAPPPAPPEDPTPKELARLAALEARERVAADGADRRAKSLEDGRREARAVAARLRRREMLVRSQLDSWEARARKLEAEADALARERDVLAVERDKAKDDLDRARFRASAPNSYAILPYKGTNGTWRRPIAIECRDGTATLMPRGPGYTLLDLSLAAGSLDPGASPLAAAVAMAATKIQGTRGPDGAPVVPYVMFVIYPDGVRPYYEARAQLEPLGIAFGYELADVDWEVEYPDLSDEAEWQLPDPTRPDARTPGTAGRAAGRRDWADRVPDAPPTAPPSPRGVGDLTGRGGLGPGGPLGDDPGLRAFDSRPAGRGFGDSEGDGGPGRGGMAGREIGPGGYGIPGSVGRGGAPGFGVQGARPGPGRFGIPRGDGEQPGGGERAAGPGPRRGTGPGAPGDPLGQGRGGTGPGEAPPIVEPPAGTGTGTLPFPPVPRPNLPPIFEPTPTAAAGGGAGVSPGPSATNGAGGLVAAPAPGAGGTSGPIVEPRAGVVGTGGFASGVTPNAPVPSAPATGTSGQVTEPKPGDAGTPSPVPDAKPALAGTTAPAAESPVGAAGASAGPQGPTGAPPGSPGLPQAGGMPRPGFVPQVLTFAGPPAGSSEGSPTQQPPGRHGRGGGGGAASKGGHGSRVAHGMVMERRPDLPLDLVVSCGPTGVIIQPGGYRLSSATLDRDGTLPRMLRSIANAQQAAEPGMTVRPTVQFLVQPRGQQTYTKARRQTILAGLGWPVTLKVAEAEPLRAFAMEAR
jgi:hypothetical protein